MEDKTFKLEIRTPQKEIFSGRISSLVVPAYEGYLGVLANHAPLLTALTSGRVTYRDPQGRAATLSLVGQGFLEVSHNQAVLLADAIATAATPAAA